MISMLLRFLYNCGYRKYIDYKIIDEWYDILPGGVYVKKYTRKYFIIRKHKRKK